MVLFCASKTISVGIKMTTSDELKKELRRFKIKIIDNIGEVKHPLNLALYQEMYVCIEEIEEKLKRIVEE